MEGGLFSGLKSPTMLGLELPIQHQNQSQNPQSSQSQNPNYQQRLNMVTYAHQDHHQQQQQQQQNVAYSFAGAISKQVSPISDDEDPNLAPEEGSNGGDGKRKMSQWQRMKWTDTMVRLLIVAVFYIGDEIGPPEGVITSADPKKKLSIAGGGAVLQKKGKWKSVSQAMFEKGFCVSPQQCEDKFNDLNKRYKRVNDILGKGTACRVVENQSLLESMELTPRNKEEVRKLLNSKHLFFREMCAYHNSCGHSNPPEPKQSLDSTHVEEEEEHEKEEEESESEDYDNDDEDEESYENLHRRARKKAKKGVILDPGSSSETIRRFVGEVEGFIGDGAKSSWEKKRWLRARALELEEKSVEYQYEAFELEKQRLKWAKFSSKKEREMEKARFENEKRRLENERMVLLVRRKQIEVFDYQNQNQHSLNKRNGNGDPSSITG